MKNCLIILGLFLFTSYAMGYEIGYLQKSAPYNTRIYQRPVYSPFSYNNSYYNPYGHTIRNVNNAKRIQRINKMRHLNRIRNNLNNLSWNLNRNNQGVLTGYSVPVNQNIYNNLGSDFWDKEFAKSPSVNTTTDIFSISPQGKNSYYNRGRLRNLNDGLGAKTGVRIIYD